MASFIENPFLDAQGAMETIAESEEDEEAEDVYSDAVEDLVVTSGESISSHLSEAYEGLKLFLNNQFHDAEELFKKKSDRSMYHSLGYATVLTYQATMTFQSADIEIAMKLQKKCLSVCDKFRRKNSFLDNLHRSRNSYSLMSPEECHAELCYAESLLQQAFLTFIQDENFVSFIKGALRIKTCLNSYKESVEIMKKRKWKDGDEMEHFQSGICAGVGAFNLMISMLPPKILKVLEFVGYKASKVKGLKELETGSSLEGSLRSPMCSLLLIVYHTIMSFIFGIGDGDLDLSRRLLESMLKKCPQSAILLCLHGRLLEVSGSLDEAILKFEQSINSQSYWKQFHHFCFWELMWCHGLSGNWLLSMKYAERLLAESNWSKSIYAYQKAIFMMMCYHDDEDNDSGDVSMKTRNKEMKEHINSLLNEVPKLRQRIAGKSVPIEKFATKKVEMYWEQQQYLTLPSYELLYLWNGYEILSKRLDLLQPVYSRIKRSKQKFKAKGTGQMYYHDNMSLLNLLECVCLRHLGRGAEAIDCFKEIINCEKNIKRDTYLVPASYFEVGMLYLNEGKYDDAKRLLETARSFSGYSVESRITSKIQAALLKIKSQSGKYEEVDVVEDLNRIQLDGNSNATVS